MQGQLGGPRVPKGHKGMGAQRLTTLNCTPGVHTIYLQTRTLLPPGTLVTARPGPALGPTFGPLIPPALSCTPSVQTKLCKLTLIPCRPGRTRTSSYQADRRYQISRR